VAAFYQEVCDMLKNNSISADNQGQRIERLDLLSANIDDHALEIGVSGARLAAAQTAGADYLDAIAEAGVQDGQMDEAFETFHQCVDDLAKLYSASKAHLLTIIWELEKPDDFIEAYGFGGESPYRYDGLTAKIETWEKNHALLVAAGDTRVLADAAMTNLIAKRDEMLALRTTAYAEKHESSEAYDALHDLFAAHTKLLSFIYSGACLAWGDDDSRLRLLGFVPSSEVWTPGEPSGEQLPTPGNFHLLFVDPNLTISWDPVEGATSYHLEMGNNPMILGTVLYEGPDTEYTFDPPGGHLYFRVWAMDGEEWGERGEAIDIEIEGTPPGPPENLQIEIMPDGKIKFFWDSPLTGIPEYCNFYLEIVDTGMPEPSMGDTPYREEIITNQAIIDNPGPGKTVYGWATAFDDGEEGEACGPESIDIP